MFDLGSSSYVRDVNAVGMRVADGEVALEGERDDHEDGRRHEDLSSQVDMLKNATSLPFITYCDFNHSPLYTENGLLTCATMSRYCPTTVITAERERGFRSYYVQNGVAR